MPYPQNVETARSVQDIIRKEGAVPATIAILDGRVHIGLILRYGLYRQITDKIRTGLDDQALDSLGQMGHKAVKASRRDLAYIMAKVCKDN